METKEEGSEHVVDNSAKTGNWLTRLFGYAGGFNSLYNKVGCIVAVGSAIYAVVSIVSNLGPPYDFSITSSPGGSVTTPGEGTFTYDDEEMVVHLVVEAEEDYQFLRWTGDVGTLADVNAATTTITIDDDYDIKAHFGWFNVTITQVATADYHTVGLKEDGTVLAVGSNSRGQCNVGGWTDIIQVAACGYHTVGLKPDGAVLAVGWNEYGQCDVRPLGSNITQVAAGGSHTVGLKPDGTVVAVGRNKYGQCNVGNWTDITQVAACGSHTVGLKEDGTVVAVGYNEHGQCDVGGWTDIIQVAAGYCHTVGLKSDGTVVAVGDNSDGQCNVRTWRNIVQVVADGWLSMGPVYGHTVGLREDGTAIAVGYNFHGQCDVGG